MARNHAVPLLITALLAAASAASGQTTPASPDSALRMILARLEGTPLPLEEAVELSLENATQVRTARASYRAARGSLQKEAGLFDPELFFALDHLDQEEPSASFFSGAPILSTAQTTSRSGLRWQLPAGTNLEASLNTVRLNTNSSFAFLNPQYTAFGNLSLRQPLLGGFRVTARKDVTRAEREMGAAKTRYDYAMLAASTAVERIYWDLYAAERDYAVQKLIRDRAEAFLAETELRAEAGLVGPGQVANARTFLAEQEILLLDREEDLDRVSDQLASMIGRRPQTPKRRFLAASEPTGGFPLEDEDILVEKAIANNLELRAAKDDIEAQRALSRAAFWEALPSVDLVGSLGGSGLAGTAQPVIFGTDTLWTTVGGDFTDASSQALRREFPSWSVGVEVSVPLGLRSGRGERERLEAEVAKGQERYLEQSRALEEQVRASYRELANGKRRLEAAREGVAAAEEQVRIGMIEFKNGRSTAFELVRLGADLAVAQQRYSQALVRSAKAAASLRQLTSGAYTGTASR